MERGAFSKYSWIDFAFSVVGVCTFLLDWGSDLWVAAEFYCHGDLLWFGALVALMVLSSCVVQMFSWFWLKYDRQLPGFRSDTGAEAVLFVDKAKLSCLLHVLQLGFLCRHISAIRQGFRVWWRKEEGSEYAVYLTHDLSMLRLIETFCESAPQLTLMIYVVLRNNKARTVQCELPSFTFIPSNRKQQQGQDRPVREHRGVDHVHGLDGGGLPPLPALLPAGQGQAGLGLLPGLLPVEPPSHFPARGRPRPLRLRPAGRLRRRPLPARLVRLRPLGLAAGDGLHGQRRRRVAVPGHGGAGLVLQLVQRGRGSDPREERHLPRLHGGGRRDPAGHLVVLQGPCDVTALRPGAASHATSHLLARTAL
ncbi:XK-related protein 8.3 isoform X2 [Nerophis lumbriciformis]|uniref:XK-related protein 8.3 isoform X2 n=1 Tax=Nerophis lumbriciformis TaxID=546530 RepID=UPI002ADFFA43|nr:uncharacterized protein LOC133621433 isoform X2 [Nerophis lumbriciformis]